MRTPFSWRWGLPGLLPLREASRDTPGDGDAAKPLGCRTGSRIGRLRVASHRPLGVAVINETAWADYSDCRIIFPADFAPQNRFNED